MGFLDKFRLRRLLSKSRGEALLASNWDSISGKRLLGYRVTGKLPVSEVREIYSRRFEASGEAFKGFAELISSLRSTTAATAKVHSFETASGTCVVFTNGRVTHLIGILIPARSLDHEAARGPQSK